MSIRTAYSTDAEQATTVLRRSIEDICGPDYENDPAILEEWLANKTVENVRSWIEGPNDAYVALSAHDRVAGFALISPSGEILLLYVLPEALGQGHGHRLLDKLETRARERGLTETRLNSTITARAFYESHGYVVTGETTGCPASQPECTPMRKRL